MSHLRACSRKQLDYATPGKRKKRSYAWIPIAVILTPLALIPLDILIRGTINTYEGKRKAALAGAHAPIIRSRIAGDKRFNDVVVGNPFPPNWIDGWVRSQSDLDALHRIVQSTSPPADFTWRVYVNPPLASQPTTDPSP
jgi:hypothetical protein